MLDGLSNFCASKGVYCSEHPISMHQTIKTDILDERTPTIRFAASEAILCILTACCEFGKHLIALK